MESLKHFSKKQKLSFTILFSFIIFIANLLAIKMSSIISGLYPLKDLEIAVITFLLILMLISIGMSFYQLLVNFDKWTKLRGTIKFVNLFSLVFLLQFVVITLIWVLIYHVPLVYKIIYR